MYEKRAAFQETAFVPAEYFTGKPNLPRNAQNIAHLLQPAPVTAAAGDSHHRRSALPAVERESLYQRVEPFLGYVQPSQIAERKGLGAYFPFALRLASVGDEPVCSCVVLDVAVDFRMADYMDYIHCAQHVAVEETEEDTFLQRPPHGGVHILPVGCQDYAPEAVPAQEPDSRQEPGDED